MSTGIIADDAHIPGSEKIVIERHRGLLVEGDEEESQIYLSFTGGLQT